jgi:peptidoglycan hydrolase CwlO-like protein
VEGRGAATIHDVALSDITTNADASRSTDDLDSLLAKKEWNQKALERSKKSIASLEAYLSSLNVQHVDVTELGKVMDNYDAVGQKLDEKVTKLEKTLKAIEADIKTERDKLREHSENAKLKKRAAIGVFAELEGEVEIVLIYGTCRVHRGLNSNLPRFGI